MTAFAAYERAVSQARSRIDRFGGKMHFPDLAQYFSRTLLKRMQRPPRKEGGLDVESRAERDKAARRAQRFNALPPALAVEAAAAGGGISDNTGGNGGPTEKEKLAARRRKFAVQMYQLLGLEAKHIFVHDPDRKDWPSPEAGPAPAVAAAATEEGEAMDVVGTDEAAVQGAALAANKVYMFGLDKGDAADAAAAVDAKSSPLPSPPPELAIATVDEKDRCDVGAFGYSLGEVMVKQQSDRWGSEGQWVRFLMRTARKGDMLFERPKNRVLPKGPVPPRTPVPPVVQAAGGKGVDSDGGGGGRGRGGAWKDGKDGGPVEESDRRGFGHGRGRSGGRSGEGLRKRERGHRDDDGRGAEGGGAERGSRRSVGSGCGGQDAEDGGSKGRKRRRRDRGGRGGGGEDEQRKDGGGNGRRGGGRGGGGGRGRNRGGVEDGGDSGGGNGGGGNGGGDNDDDDRRGRRGRSGSRSD
ncbi:unnamed protein product [Phaeothamnion confervicola]